MHTQLTQHTLSSCLQLPLLQDTAKKIIEVWEQSGARSPDDLRKILLKRSAVSGGVVLLQSLLDVGASPVHDTGRAASMCHVQTCWCTQVRHGEVSAQEPLWHRQATSQGRLSYRCFPSLARWPPWIALSLQLTAGLLQLLAYFLGVYFAIGAFAGG